MMQCADLILLVVVPKNRQSGPLSGFAQRSSLGKFEAKVADPKKRLYNGFQL